MKEKSIFFAITGDVIKSKKIYRRDKFQNKLIKICEIVNGIFREYILAEFSIIAGDEFQGLVKKNTPLFEIIEYFEKSLYPVKIRFGIGEGRISTSFYLTTSKMDGECFINSRIGIEKAKKENRIVKFILRDKNIEKIVDLVMLWIEKTKGEWNSLIYRRYCLYKELGSISEVAKKEKVSKQSVGKSLKRARYDLILKSEKILTEILSAERG